MIHLYREKISKIKEGSILDLYKTLLDEVNYKSESILFIVPNSATKLNYERTLDIEFSGALNITTYIGFIKKEIIKFWPLITENCDQIKNKSISPIFIPSSLSEYIIINKVKEQRNNGYFQDITATNRSIANSINNNINKSVFGFLADTTKIN